MQIKTVQPGFSFIELMVVLALLGLLGAFVVPNIFKSNRGAEQKKLLISFKTMVQDATLRAITTNQIHQIFFDITNECIQLRIYDPQSLESNQHKKFRLVKDSQFLTQIPFFKQFVIKNFFINGVDEVKVGNTMYDVSFYIMPDGTSQPIVINCIDENEIGSTQNPTFSIVVNPFYARVLTHETFQEP